MALPSLVGEGSGVGSVNSSLTRYYRPYPALRAPLPLKGGEWLRDGIRWCKRLFQVDSHIYYGISSIQEPHTRRDYRRLPRVHPQEARMAGEGRGRNQTDSFGTSAIQHLNPMNPLDLTRDGGRLYVKKNGYFLGHSCVLSVASDHRSSASTSEATKSITDNLITLSGARLQER